MKIKRDKRIQDAVDKRQGHAITGLAALHVCAVEYAGRSTDSPNEIDGQNKSAACVDAFALGVEKAMELARKAQKRKDILERAYHDGKITTVSRTFGIYVAEQETSDGNDYLYFVGTPDEILMKLQSIPATESSDPCELVVTFKKPHTAEQVAKLDKFMHRKGTIDTKKIVVYTLESAPEGLQIAPSLERGEWAKLIEDATVTGD